MPSFSIADHLFLFSVGLSVRRTSSSCPRLIGLLSEKAGTFISNGGINFIQLKDFNTAEEPWFLVRAHFFFNWQILTLLQDRDFVVLFLSSNRFSTWTLIKIKWACTLTEGIFEIVANLFSHMSAYMRIKNCRLCICISVLSEFALKLYLRPCLLVCRRSLLIMNISI